MLIRILAAALRLCDWSAVGAYDGDEDHDPLASWSNHSCGGADLRGTPRP